MDYLTLSQDVRVMYGISASHILFNDSDIMIMLRQINDKAVIFDCPEVEIEIDKEYLIKFNSKLGFIEIDIKVTSFYKNEYMFSVEALITGINKNDFLIALNNFMQKLLIEKKRKEERILCNQKNLEKLHLINHFLIVFHNREFNCIIKDISISGIKFFTNFELLYHKNEKFNIKLKFNEPEDTFYFTDCKVLRKSEYIFNGIQLAEVVINIEPNFKFTSRINNFYNEENKITRKR